MIQIIFIAIILFATLVYAFMQLPRFGALPRGERLQRVAASPNYRNGRFRNRIEKPAISEGYSIPGEMYKMLFRKNPRRYPSVPLPSVQTDLRALPKEQDLMVWFGHSSFLLQMSGVRMLVDPVFSGKASPLPGSVKAFAGTDVYNVEDMPDIDYLILSHDHYDHLDYPTIKALRTKVAHVVCGLGAGAHFERWGYDGNIITELDWSGSIQLSPELQLTAESAQHDSGRAFARGRSLWLSFLFRSAARNLYYSGDGGYDDRFRNIADKYGPVDWAIRECGQYNKAWQSVHELPEEMALATRELGAAAMIPVHHSKFTLAHHSWDEPLEKVSEYAAAAPYRLVTPMIGEPVFLSRPDQTFSQWWKGLS
ncbi:MBL fold metallo-hydrolase [Rurimicrobium arvi]|uniref:MBL fold metallo-hydrolase n=1 Tax=Rurimicrobium arvi TaxID=2049916 RepID=A0ABP8MY16_9BACT